MANFNFNKVILGGRLTATPELKKTQSGLSVVTFTIAVNRRTAKEANPEEAKADFIVCTAWRQTAEFIAQYFRKGSSICVVGSIQTRSWTDQSGQKRYATEILVDEVHFVDSKTEGSGGATPSTATYQTTAPAPVPPMSSTESMAQIAGFTPSPKFENLADDEELPF